MKFIRLLTLCLGIAGSVIFAGAFVASWTSEHFIGETAREVIRYRVAQEMNEKIDALGADFDEPTQIREARLKDAASRHKKG